MITNHETFLLLDDIRSVHNVGSIFRTAECAGVSEIYCLGTTPVPVDRFGRKRGDFAKVSLGAEDMVRWKHIDSGEVIHVIGMLKEEGFTIVAIEQGEDAINYSEYVPSGKTLYIFGNEVDGVSSHLIGSADEVVEIEMKGRKESLNVSVAVGVILFNCT